MTGNRFAALLLLAGALFGIYKYGFTAQAVYATFAGFFLAGVGCVVLVALFLLFFGRSLRPDA